MSRRDYDDRYDDRRTNVSRRTRADREYDEVDETRSRYDGPAPSRYDPPQQSRRTETVFKERETDTRTERRGPRQPDFLREDYGRNANAGELVVRERREEDEYTRAPSRRRSMESVRSRPGPAPARTERVEKDEFVFQERERNRGGAPYPRSERGSFGEEEKVIIRERTSSRPPPNSGRSREEIDIRIREEQRPGWSPPPRGEIRERDNVEEIRIRRGDGGRPSPPRTEVDKEEITLTRRERDGPPPGRREFDREEVTFEETRSPRESNRGREVRKEEIDIDIRERSAQPPRQRSQSRGDLVRRDREEWIVRRPRTPSPSPPREVVKEEIIIRRKERSPSPIPEPPREPTPEPLPQPPEPIYRPPIIQEVITHHRHIDHGIERARSPTPPPPPPSPPKEEDLEISIRRSGTRNGKTFDEEITIEKDTIERGGREERRDRSRAVSRDNREITRRRSVSASTRGGRDDISSEADYYNRRVGSRAYPGEAYNGATRDWGLVDIPPGTERVRMDGAGGGAQEITWARYNGERHGKFMTGGREYDESWGNGGPRSALPPSRPEPREEVRETRITERRTVEESSAAPPRKKERMWTEITKDLVIKEAVEESGYEYEETDGFFYVMEYLRYEDVLKLVQVTEDIRKERRERLREIQWQREEIDRHPKMLPPPMPQVPPPPRGPPGRYDERVYEKEVTYDRDRRRYR